MKRHRVPPLPMHEQESHAVHALYSVARAVMEDPDEFPPRMGAYARAGDLRSLVDYVAFYEANNLRNTRLRGGYTEWSRVIGGYGPFKDHWRTYAVDRLRRAIERGDVTIPAPTKPRENPPRKGALVEIVKRDDGHWFRNTLGHLEGPYRTRRDALGDGVMALARALHPHASHTDLVEIANALLTEDRSRPYVRRFSDGWRVWHPERELFVGRGPGQPFATEGEAQVRRRELAGEAVDDGPMFRRPAPAMGAVQPGLFGGASSQLGLFAARENPGAVGHLEFGPGARGHFTVGSKTYRGEVWFYVDVIDADGRPLGGGSAITTFGPDGVGPAWVSRGELGDGTHRGIVYPRARWADGDSDAGVIVVERREPARPNPSQHLAPLRGAPGESVIYHRGDDGLVLVRASHAGAGTSEREMSPASARAHRERLLALGYRPNPSRRASSTARRPRSIARRSR
jgi:hypothetical protein